MERQGKRLVIAPAPWHCGEAEIVGDSVSINIASAKEYSLNEININAALDFAMVRLPGDAAKFIKKYGLLKSGPAESGPESFKMWETEARQLYNILDILRALKSAKEGGPRAIQELWSWYNIIDDFMPAIESQPSAQTDEQMFLRMNRYVGMLINRGLAGVELRVHAVPQWTYTEVEEEQGLFDMSFTSPHLLGRLYQLLASAITNNVRMDVCIECERRFIVKDQRMKYCSDRCANRARQRRKRQNKEAKP